MAVDKERHFVTPINRRDFLYETSCEWVIVTRSEAVVLSIFVADIEEENELAVRASPANIPDGSNLTTIMIEVSR